MGQPDLFTGKSALHAIALHIIKHDSGSGYEAGVSSRGIPEAIQLGRSRLEGWVGPAERGRHPHNRQGERKLYLKQGGPGSGRVHELKQGDGRIALLRISCCIQEVINSSKKVPLLSVAKWMLVVRKGEEPRGHPKAVFEKLPSDVQQRLMAAASAEGLQDMASAHEKAVAAHSAAQDDIPQRERSFKRSRKATSSGGGGYSSTDGPDCGNRPVCWELCEGHGDWMLCKGAPAFYQPRTVTGLNLEMVGTLQHLLQPQYAAPPAPACSEQHSDQLEAGGLQAPTSDMQLMHQEAQPRWPVMEPTSVDLPPITIAGPSTL